MKTLYVFATLICCLPLAIVAESAPEKPVDITDFQVAGDIQGENITFTLAFQAKVNQAPSEIKLIEGNLVFLQGLPAVASAPEERPLTVLGPRSGQDETSEWDTSPDVSNVTSGQATYNTPVPGALHAAPTEANQTPAPRLPAGTQLRYDPEE